MHQIIDEVKEMFRQSGLAVPAMVDLEISHHYGLDRFVTPWCMMPPNCEYCKKLLIMLGQGHPPQYQRARK